MHQSPVSKTLVHEVFGLLVRQKKSPDALRLFF